MKLTVYVIIYSVWLSAFGYSSTNYQGKYSGVFQKGNFQIDLTIEIEESDKGSIVFFTSMGQNAFRIPTRDLRLNNDSLHFTLQSDRYSYHFLGEISQQYFKGEVQVDSRSYPLELFRDSGENEIKKEVVTFKSNGLKLEGAIWHPTISNGIGLFMITSSGYHGRSSSNSEAYNFSREGYTVFHFDKRGTGNSGGSLTDVSIKELTSDDSVAVQFFSRYSKINISNIGVMGSSQGGAKIPYLLSRLPEIKFGICVSTPGSSLLESDLNYMMNTLKDQIDPDDINEATASQRKVYEYLSGQLSRTKLTGYLEQKKEEKWYNLIWIPELTDEVYQGLSYSPIPYFEKCNHPLLIIQGSSDIVIPSYSSDAIRSALTNAGNSNFEVVILENANHSMTYEGSSDFTYWQNLHPLYFEIILSWMKKMNFN